MQKLINKPENFVDEMLEGVLRAHPGAWGSKTRSWA